MHRSNRIGLWVVVLVVALVVGWVADRQWQVLRWFQGEPPVQQAAVQPPVESQPTATQAQVATSEPSEEQPEAQRAEAADAPQAEPGETAAAQPEATPETETPAPAPAAGPEVAAAPSASQSAPGADEAAADSSGGETAATPQTAASSEPSASAATPATALSETAMADPATAAPQAQETATPSDSDAAAAPPAGDEENPAPMPEDVAASGGTPQEAEEADVADSGPVDTDAASPEESQAVAATDPAQIQPETAADAPEELAGTDVEPVAAEGADVEVAAAEPGKDDQATASADPAQAVAAVSGEPAVAAGRGPGQDPQSTSSAESSSDEQVAGLLAEAKPGIPPSFDIVRVGPDGRAVIAGRAEPGAEVELRSGTEVIDRVRASPRGDWVAVPGKPLDPGDQQLTLVAVQPGAAAIESDQMVVVAVPEPAPATAPVASAGMSQPMAVVLPRDGSGTGRILQAPGRLSAKGTLALMAVSYDDLGQMRLSGEAPPGVPVRVYVDNEPMGLVVGDANGAWSSGLDQVLEPGTYTLRLDQLDADGQAVARIETPITRVSEPPIEGHLQVDYVVVQPGNSLWRIARRLSGRGMNYVYIFDSNQAQIRDPDLIYPGQVFQIPPEFGTAG